MTQSDAQIISRITGAPVEKLMADAAKDAAAQKAREATRRPTARERAAAAQKAREANRATIDRTPGVHAGRIETGTAQYWDDDAERDSRWYD